MSGRDGIPLCLCFLRQRSDDLMGQLRFGHEVVNAIFSRNTLFPESLCAVTTCSIIDGSSVFFAQDESGSGSHRPETSTVKHVNASFRQKAKYGDKPIFIFITAVTRAEAL
jgi:hypothetical protein